MTKCDSCRYFEILTFPSTDHKAKFICMKDYSYLEKKLRKCDKHKTNKERTYDD